MFESEEIYSGCSRQARLLRGGGVHPEAQGMRRQGLYKASGESISGIWNGFRIRDKKETVLDNQSEIMGSWTRVVPLEMRDLRNALKMEMTRLGNGLNVVERDNRPNGWCHFY